MSVEVNRKTLSSPEMSVSSLQKARVRTPCACQWRRRINRVLSASVRTFVSKTLVRIQTTTLLKPQAILVFDTAHAVSACCFITSSERSSCLLSVLLSMRVDAVASTMHKSARGRSGVLMLESMIVGAFSSLCSSTRIRVVPSHCKPLEEEAVNFDPEHVEIDFYDEDLSLLSSACITKDLDEFKLDGEVTITVVVSLLLERYNQPTAIVEARGEMKETKNDAKDAIGRRRLARYFSQ